jgi:hypothetical protein
MELQQPELDFDQQNITKGGRSKGFLFKNALKLKTSN